MIKRIVGLLAAVAVLAVVVFAILGSGTYSSFIGRAGRSAAAPAATLSLIHISEPTRH